MLEQDKGSLRMPRNKAKSRDSGFNPEQREFVTLEAKMAKLDLTQFLKIFLKFLIFVILLRNLWIFCILAFQQLSILALGMLKQIANIDTAVISKLSPPSASSSPFAP